MSRVANAPLPSSDPAAVAEEAKALGNDAFKAGDYGTVRYALRSVSRAVCSALVLQCTLCAVRCEVGARLCSGCELPSHCSPTACLPSAPKLLHRYTLLSGERCTSRGDGLCACDRR